MRSLYLLMITVVLLLPGCDFSGTPSWLAGDWSFDADTSKRAMTESTPAKDSSLMSGLSSMLGGMLLPQLDGMELRITGHDLMTLVHGNGTSQTFQIVSQSDQECLIKTADGKLCTFYHAGDAIYQYPDGGGQIKIFYKRKS